MKVKVIVTLDVDQEAWAREFGLYPSASEVRKDVQLYFDVLCQGQLNDVLDLGKE